MPATKTPFAPERLRLARAADLMTANPVSIREDATLAELVAMLTERNISGAPVINEAGRPIGVVSQADVLVHDRERSGPILTAADQDWSEPDDAARASRGTRALAETVHSTKVHEIMTPVVFSVSLNTPAEEVVEELVRMKVHRLFVVDEDGALVGVVSPLDVLRYMM
jgi:CBS domain-containing protein